MLIQLTFMEEFPGNPRRYYYVTNDTRVALVDI